MVYFRGQKGWATPRLVYFRGSIQYFRQVSPPLSFGSPPPSLLSPDRALTILLLFIPCYRKEFLPYLDESFKEVLKLVQVGRETKRSCVLTKFIQIQTVGTITKLQT